MRPVNGGGIVMKTSNVGRLGALLLGLLQIVPLSGCFLDRSGIVADYFKFDCEATIVSGDGVRSVVSSTALAEFQGGDAAVVFAGAPELGHPEQEARLRFRRFLLEVIARRAADPAFAARFGTGDFCVGEVAVEATGLPVATSDPAMYWGGGDPLRSCDGSCGDSCGNTGAARGALDVEPSAADDPLRVDFGSVAVRGMVEQVVTLTNTGDGYLCLDSPGILPGPDAADFTLTPIDGCDPEEEGGVRLAPTEACRVRVRFSPLGAGTRSARMPVGSGCGHHLTLTGVGLAGVLAASPAPTCVAAPVPPETCGPEREIQVTNGGPGSVPLRAVSVTSAGSDGLRVRLLDAARTEIALATPFVLPEGAHVFAAVRSCRATAGAGTLSILHDGADQGMPGSATGDLDPGSPLTVALAVCAP